MWIILSFSWYRYLISFCRLQFSFAEFIVFKATVSFEVTSNTDQKNARSSATFSGLSASTNNGRTSGISIYKLLVCQFRGSRFNRTWIYANKRSHYAFDSQSPQNVSFNGSFAIELHTRLMFWLAVLIFVLCELLHWRASQAAGGACPANCSISLILNCWQDPVTGNVMETTEALSRCEQVSFEEALQWN